MTFRKQIEEVFMGKPWQIDYDGFTLEISVERSGKHYVKCSFREINQKSGKRENYKQAYNSTFRFFNEIVWFYNAHIFNVGGGHSHNSHVGLYYQVDTEQYLLGFQQKVFDQKQHLALAFYREAECNESPYYRFLCYAKILEIPFEKGTLKGAWIEEQIPKLEDSLATSFRDRKIAALHDKTLADWLQKDGRHAIAHSNHGIVRDPNNYDDWDDIKWGNTVMEELAIKLMVEVLGVPRR